jgi:DNA polymerase-3 subunit delta'
MQLKDIHSQDSAIAGLQRAFASGRMAHAYLFVGPDGVGKRTTAQAWAKMLLCHNRVEKKIKGVPFVDSCGQCRSCKLFDAGTHPDYKPIVKELRQYTKDGKDKTAPLEMPIDVIREFVIDKVANKPVESEFSVFVIDEAEKVNPHSQNAMLKVLEEPPAFCVLILLCSRLEQMLPTTKSRCRLISFGPVAESFILSKLKPIAPDDHEALYWARFSEGRLGEAIAWAAPDPDPDPEEKSPRAYEIKKELTDRISRLELADVVDTAAWMGQSAKALAAAWIRQNPKLSPKDLTRRAQKGLIRMIIALLSDVIGNHLGKNTHLVNSDQVSAVKKLAAVLDSEQAAEKILALQNLLGWVDDSVNEKLIFEQVLFKLSLSDILPVSPV